MLLFKVLSLNAPCFSRVNTAALGSTNAVWAGGLAAPALAAGIGAAIGLAGGSAAVATGVTGVATMPALV